MENRFKQINDRFQTEHHLTIGPSGGAEWIRRLKANEPVTLHKSTECIVAKVCSKLSLLSPIKGNKFPFAGTNHRIRP